MSEFCNTGFAAKLLDRAAGLSGSLRPRITPYFSSPDTSAAPLTAEEPLDRPAPLHEQQAPKNNRPRRVIEEEPLANNAVPFAEVHSERQVEEPRLMPPVAPEKEGVAPQSVAPKLPPDAGGRPVSKAAAHLAPISERPFSEPKSNQTEVEPNAPLVSVSSAPQARSPDVVSAPDLERVLAAAVARLTPSPQSNDETALMPEADLTSVIPATLPPGAPELLAPQPDHNAQAPAPLHIHIGEVVIAPDPQDQIASKVASATQQPEWKPMLTLDAYKEQRGRKRT